MKLRVERRTWIYILSMLSATMFLVLLFSKVNWGKVWYELEQVNPYWLIFAALIHILILIFWAVQWKIFLPRFHEVSFSRMFEISSIMAMTMNTVPFLAGHALGVFLLARQKNIGNITALSVMSLDQFMEALGKLAVLFMLALLVPLPIWIKTNFIMLLIIFILLALLLFSFARHYRVLEEKHSNPGWERWPRIRSVVARWANNLETMRSPRRFTAALALALLMKITELFAIWGIQKSFGLEMPLWSLPLVLGALNFATMIPIAPANLGIYEATVFFIYQYLGVSSELSFNIAVMQHICYLLPLCGTGYLILIIKKVPLPNIGIGR